jgi:hypothetical protein
LNKSFHFLDALDKLTKEKAAVYENKENQNGGGHTKHQSPDQLPVSNTVLSVARQPIDADGEFYGFITIPKLGERAAVFVGKFMGKFYRSSSNKKIYIKENGIIEKC